MAETEGAAAPKPKLAAATSISALIELISSGAVLPVRASYVCDLAKAGKCLEPREALPEKAMWTGEQLSLLLRSLKGPFAQDEAERRMATLFVGVAWRWLTPTHPDPDGKQLAGLAAVANLYLGAGAGSQRGAPTFARGASSVLVGGGGDETLASSSWRSANVCSEVFEPLGLEASADFAMLIDYSSFAAPEGGGAPQGQRRATLPAEARQALLLWLSHPAIALWMLTDRGGGAGGSGGWWEAGGWPFTERAIAELSKPAHLRLDLSLRKAAAADPTNAPPISATSAADAPAATDAPAASPAASLARRASSASSASSLFFSYTSPSTQLSSFGSVAAACVGPRSGPPLAPQAFAALLAASADGDGDDDALLKPRRASTAGAPPSSAPLAHHGASTALPKDFGAAESGAAAAEREYAASLYSEAFTRLAPVMTTLDLHGQASATSSWAASPSGVIGFLNALPQLRSLGTLDVSGGWLKHEAGKALAACLAALPNLHTLNGSGCRLANTVSVGATRALSHERGSVVF